MIDDSRARFEKGAASWADYNQKPLGRIRREVTWHNLAPYLPDVSKADDPPRVLDAGGGSGELALRMVQHGYRVWLLDYATTMLDRAGEAARELPDEVRARLTLCHMPVEDAPHAFTPGFFEAITCHTLIEYVPDPRGTLQTLVGLLRGGGLLSLSYVNIHAELLRQVWSRGDPAGALTKLGSGAFRASLFGISGMAYSAEEASGWLAELDLTPQATCGVRSFADYLPRERLDDPWFFDALLRLELAAATRRPYQLIARYVHLLAQKNVELS
jgi:S-adenosylmethionine-dependent methyltransferase